MDHLKSVDRLYSIYCMDTNNHGGAYRWLGTSRPVGQVAPKWNHHRQKMKEAARIRTFVCEQLRDEPDLRYGFKYWSVVLLWERVLELTVEKK